MSQHIGPTWTIWQAIQVCFGLALEFLNLDLGPNLITGMICGVFLEICFTYGALRAMNGATPDATSMLVQLFQKPLPW